MTTVKENSKKYSEAVKGLIVAQSCGLRCLYTRITYPIVKTRGIKQDINGKIEREG